MSVVPIGAKCAGGVFFSICSAIVFVRFCTAFIGQVPCPTVLGFSSFAVSYVPLGPLS